MASNNLVSVEDYSLQFFAKYLKKDFGRDDEENFRVASERFYGLLKKVEAAGEREDVAVPLRALRDEITSANNRGGRGEREECVERLFCLYDGVNDFALQRPQDSSIVMEELRMRLFKLVTGETWEPHPKLKLMALHRMRIYMLAEQSTQRTYGPRVVPTPTRREIMSRKISSKILKPTLSSWEALWNDLPKASSMKMFTLLKSLMEEVEELQAKAGTQSAPPPQAAATAAVAPPPSAPHPTAPAQRATAPAHPQAAPPKEDPADSLLLNLDLGGPPPPSVHAAPAPAPVPVPVQAAAAAPPPASTGWQSFDPFAQKEAPPPPPPPPAAAQNAYQQPPMYAQQPPPPPPPQQQQQPLYAAAPTASNPFAGQAGQASMAGGQVYNGNPPPQNGQPKYNVNDLMDLANF